MLNSLQRLFRGAFQLYFGFITIGFAHSQPAELNDLARHSLKYSEPLLRWHFVGPVFTCF
jgi:hypothetical protein